MIKWKHLKSICYIASKKSSLSFPHMSTCISSHLEVTISKKGKTCWYFDLNESMKMTTKCRIVSLQTQKNTTTQKGFRFSKSGWNLICWTDSVQQNITFYMSTACPCSKLVCHATKRLALSFTRKPVEDTVWPTLTPRAVVLFLSTLYPRIVVLCPLLSAWALNLIHICWMPLHLTFIPSPLSYLFFADTDYSESQKEWYHPLENQGILIFWRKMLT